jgi:O-antigen/teichoic acid export membrane protein
LFRNTVSMLAGFGARLLIQGVYFVLIARALGAEQYGAFIGVAALVAILAPFSPFGTGQIIIRNVARDRRTFSYSWGNALWMTSVSGSVLLGVVLLLARYVLAAKIPLTLVFLVGCSDLLLAAVVGVAALAFQAVEQLHWTAQIQVVPTAARAAGAVALVLSVRHPTALSWGFFYLGSSAIGAVYAIAIVSSKLGAPRLSLRRLRSDLLEGFYFAISLSSSSIYNNIDKTMLVRLATFGAAGIYAAAYRLMDLSFQPVSALLASTYPRFFQQGSQGLQGTKRLARRFLPFAVGYALLAGALLVLAAPVLPLVLGHDFGESVAALRWLSPIVLFRAVHYFLADALTGAGFQGLRSAIQVFIAGLNVVLNLWLTPAYSWRGAAWASIVSDGMLAVCMFLAILFLERREEMASAPCDAEPRVVS